MFKHVVASKISSSYISALKMISSSSSNC